MTLIKRLHYKFASAMLIISKRKRNIPNKIVQIQFKSKYPRATYVQWNQIDVFKWQVNFSIKDDDFSALFRSNGTWLETVSMVSLGLTPKQVQESFKQKYNPEGLQKIHHIETSMRDVFEIQWSNGVFVWKLLYDISGKILGKLIV